MKRAGVAELKARFSAYLRGVRSGETVLVMDRSTPIAKLSPVEPSEDDVVIRGPSGPLPAIDKVKPVRLLKKVDLVGIMRESRDHR